MGLEGELTASVGTDDVTFTYRVTNAGDRPATLEFRTGQRYDIAVTPVDGESPVWRASDGRAYTMALGTLTLEAGEGVTYDDRMPVPPPGAYEAVAALATASGDATAETTFSVG